MKKKLKFDNSKKAWMVRFLIFLILLYVCDIRLRTVRYTFESPKVDAPVKVALLTDLHGSWYGKEQGELIKAIDKEAPDAVLLGGDIFDDKVSYRESEETLRILSRKYKCYYVTGNHEFWSEDIENILNIVRSCGVTVLRGDVDTLEIRGQYMDICGVDDPDGYGYGADAKSILQQLDSVSKQCDAAHYSILLSHRPEYFEHYGKYHFDLVLTGHAHGGQWRIPGLINGLYAPNQGVFPKYAGGLYDYEGGTMVVSRGLDRWGIKLPRIFNRPELVIIEVR